MRLTEAWCFWTGIGIQCLWSDANGTRGIRGGGVPHRRCGVCELGMAFSKKVMGESPCQPRMHNWMPWWSGAARGRRPGQTGPALAPPFTAKAAAVAHGFAQEDLGGSWPERRLPGMNVHLAGMPLMHLRPDGSIPLLYPGQGLPHPLLYRYPDFKPALTTTPHIHAMRGNHPPPPCSGWCGKRALSAPLSFSLESLLLRAHCR